MTNRTLPDMESVKAALSGRDFTSLTDQHRLNNKTLLDNSVRQLTENTVEKNKNTTQ